MAAQIILTGVLIEDNSMLTVEDLARVCAVEPHWVVERVEAGLLGLFADGPESRSLPDASIQNRTVWRFASAQMLRARRLAALERDMDANPELAALVADLVEEVQYLRRCRQPVV